MKTKLDLPLLLIVLLLGPFGAGALFAIGQLTWMMVWLGLWLILSLVVLVKQIGGSDAAASAVFVFAGIGSLVSSGIHVNLSPFTIGFDPLGFILASILLVVAVGAILWRVSTLVFVSRGGDKRQSFTYLLTLMMGGPTIYLEAKEGKLFELPSKPQTTLQPAPTQASPTVKRTKVSLGICVHPGNAVVYEMNGEYAGVLPPGMHYLGQNESVHKVIVTYQRSGGGTLKDVMTKDGIPLTIDYSVSYRITPSMEPEMGKPYPYSADACKQAAYNAPNWESNIVNGAGGLIADKVAGMELEELFELRDPATYPLGAMMGKLKAKLQGGADRYGAIIFGMDIDRVELPPTVRERMLAQWQSDQDKQSRLKFIRELFGLVADKDGKYDPQVALRLLETVMGSDKNEGISASHHEKLMQEKELREMMLVDALTRQRQRASASGVQPIIATPRPS